MARGRIEEAATMKLVATVNDTELQFDLEQELAITSVNEVEPGLYTILRNGRSLQARVTKDQVEIGGRTLNVEVRDPRERSRKGAGAGASGRQNILAPMPGKVIRVLVGNGEAVEAGQGLIVVEAMKMQNEMKSPKAGTVVQVNATEGATVAVGETLLIIE
jgi:biotin carboxyl carrier protein